MIPKFHASAQTFQPELRHRGSVPADTKQGADLKISKNSMRHCRQY
jgi:hypothetical protein